MTMYFFDIKSLSQLQNYMDWVEQQRTYPVEFYLNGMCYELRDKKSLEHFCAGQEAMFNTIWDVIK